MTKSNAIKKLHQQGQSQHQIAEALSVDRKTVRRHLQNQEPAQYAAADSKGTGAPTGSDDPPPVSQAVTSASQCEPFRQLIQDKLDQGLHAQRIFQDLQLERDYQGKYWSVRRFVKKLRTENPQAFRRIEVAPGWEAQVDFGTGAPVVGKDGKRRRTHVLRVVLSHSRKGYAEVVFRQTTDDFIAALENAFWHFGGVPKTVVIDNLRAAVKNPDWYDPELVPKLRAFEQHYGITILPTRPYTPRHKGKVERGVDYVQENALRGRSFATLLEQNDFLTHWEATVADLRIHGTTRKQVGSHFEAAEKDTLLPLPTERFANFSEARRKVNRDGHVAIDRAFYSAPPEYVGRNVWARWDARTVRLLDDDLKTIAVFARSEQGKFNTKTQHIASEKINSVERGSAYLLKKTAFIGVHSTRWSQSMLRQRGIAGTRVLQGLLSLTNQYRCDQIEQACEIAWRHGDFHLRTIRKLIQRGGPVQELMPFLEDHELIRPLADYERFVHECVQNQLTS
ncbi:IS21 family transposase [Rubripirellula tenax]|uniref:IS21 family transposase n=1 Tax=Rubripirellula tenax TaxID=2528015 RepID=UPI0016447F49|nr:IS21 family transposase [Rubripirellula tenax]